MLDMVLIKKAFFIRCRENTKNVSNADSDRGRFFTPLRVRDDSKFLNLHANNVILIEKRFYKHRPGGMRGAIE